MIILSIDTSAGVASVALVSEERIISEFTVDNKKTHSENLMPMVENIFAMTNMALQDVDYIAVSVGPGSFTGLRIGAAAAKALAHGVNKMLVPVPTLDALAYNSFDEKRIIVPVMDARRNQVYTCFYEWNGGNLVRLSDYMAEDFGLVLERVRNDNRGALFLGDGTLVPAYRDAILQAHNSFAIALVNNRQQRAASVGVAALSMVREGTVENYRELELMYLRKPQAEREREQRISIKND